MSLETWIAFCLTETILCFTPGPAVLYVVSAALSPTAVAGLRATFGILTANAIYFALSATSIGVVLATTWQLFLALKVLGAVYLVWLGLRMIFARRPEPKVEAATPRRGARYPFLTAVMIQGANPKALIFFTAILSQFIDHRYPVASQMLILGGSSLVIEFSVLSLYVITCRRARAWASNPRFARPLEQLGGVLLIAAAVGLAAADYS